MIEESQYFLDFMTKLWNDIEFGSLVMALSHHDDLASVCRRMKTLANSYAGVRRISIMGKFCIS